MRKLPFVSNAFRAHIVELLFCKCAFSRFLISTQKSIDNARFAAKKSGAIVKTAETSATSRRIEQKQERNRTRNEMPGLRRSRAARKEPHVDPSARRASSLARPPFKPSWKDRTDKKRLTTFAIRRFVSLRTRSAETSPRSAPPGGRPSPRPRSALGWRRWRCRLRAS